MPTPMRTPTLTMTMAIEQVKLVDICVDADLQSRAEIDGTTVRDYASDIKRGDVFPEVIVFTTDEKTYWMADGFHRWHAHHLLKKRMISADVREGNQRDAILFGLGANVGHGLRRSNADKRQSVVTMLSDSEWKHWSDGHIAKHCCVTGQMVKNYREKLHDQPDQVRKYTRKGKEQTMNLTSGPSKDAKKSPVKDSTGKVILVDELAEVFEERAKLKSLYSRISDIRKEIKVVSAKRIGIYMNQQEVDAEFKSILGALKFSKPYAVCPTCEGDTCEQCRYSGFIPKEIYERLPETAKQY